MGTESAYIARTIYPPLKGSTDCAAASEQARVFAAQHTQTQVSIMLCFQLETAIQGDKVGGCVIVQWFLSGAHLVSVRVVEMRFQPIFM